MRLVRKLKKRLELMSTALYNHRKQDNVSFLQGIESIKEPASNTNFTGLFNF